MRSRLPALTAVAASALALVGFAVASPAAASTPGDLDTTFSTDGIVVGSIFSGQDDDEANAVAIQPNGQIVLAGKAYDGTSFPHMAIMRYNANGSMDTAFGATAKVVVPYFFGTGEPPDTNGDQANAIALQPDGKILIAGAASAASGAGALAIARYNSDGTPDATFGTAGNGQVLVQVGTNGFDDSVNGIAVQPDGGIVLAGTWAGGWAVARLTSSGMLDTTFDAAGVQPGVQAFDLGDPLADGAHAVVIEPLKPSGFGIVVGGSAAHVPGTPGNFNEDFGVVRLTSSGTFDPSFSGDGVARVSVGGTYDSVTSLLVQADGKIVAAGLGATAGGTTAVSVARFSAAGGLDVGFNGTGRETLDVSNEQNAPLTGIVQASDAGLIVASTATGGNDDVLLTKLTSSGALDPGFGSGGIVTTSVRNANSVDRVTGAVLDPNGRLDVVGSSTAAQTTRYFIDRYLTAAAPTFAVKPVSTTTCAPANTTSFTVAVTAAAPVSFAWQELLPGGAHYIALRDGTLATGASVTGTTTATISFSGLTAADNGTKVRAFATNGGGTTYSLPATLTVGDTPAITQQPAPVTTGQFGFASFTGAASGTPAPTAQWYVQTGGAGTFTLLGGQTDPTLAFDVSLSDDGNRYRVKFTNVCGNATSAGATLHVHASGG